MDVCIKPQDTLHPSLRPLFSASFQNNNAASSVKGTDEILCSSNHTLSCLWQSVVYPGIDLLKQADRYGPLITQRLDSSGWMSYSTSAFLE